MNAKQTTFNEGLNCGEEHFDYCSGNDMDECGVCGGTGIPAGACDCNGNLLDRCGVCNGDETCNCDDMDGNYGHYSFYDENANNGNPPNPVDCGIGAECFNMDSSMPDWETYQFGYKCVCDEQNRVVTHVDNYNHYMPGHTGNTTYGSTSSCRKLVNCLECSALSSTDEQLLCLRTADRCAGARLSDCDEMLPGAQNECLIRLSAAGQDVLDRDCGQCLEFSAGAQTHCLLLTVGETYADNTCEVVTHCANLAPGAPKAYCLSLVHAHYVANPNKEVHSCADCKFFEEPGDLAYVWLR